MACAPPGPWARGAPPSPPHLLSEAWRDKLGELVIKQSRDILTVLAASLTEDASQKAIQGRALMNTVKTLCKDNVSYQASWAKIKVYCKRDIAELSKNLDKQTAALTAAKPTSKQAAQARCHPATTSASTSRGPSKPRGRPNYRETANPSRQSNDTRRRSRDTSRRNNKRNRSRSQSRSNNSEQQLFKLFQIFLKKQKK